jgi:hypothetical protein
MTGHVAMGRMRHNRNYILMEFQLIRYTLKGEDRKLAASRGSYPLEKISRVNARGLPGSSSIMLLGLMLGLASGV